MAMNILIGCGAEPAFDPDSPRDCGANQDCRSGEVCLNGYGCYPRYGWADTTCGPAVAIDIELDVPGLGSDPGLNELVLTGVVTADTVGTVSSATAHTLSVVHGGETTEIGYDLGPYSVPLAVGETVHILARRVYSFGRATGLAMTEPETGRLVALIDDGHWGSAWEPGSTPMSGFTVDTELLGCAIEKYFCYDYAPLGMRFSHGDGTNVLALPGDEASLSVGGRLYHVINAFAEQIGNVECTDVSPRRAWAIIRAE